MPVAAEQPALDPETPWMRHLEQAHALAHEAVRAIEEQAEPSVHFAPAARKLELGLGALYDALDGRADRPTAIGLCHSRLWAAAMLCAHGGLPPAVQALCGACRELIAAEQRLLGATAAPAGAAPPLVAGADLPRLHRLDRPSLSPVLRAPRVPEPAPELPAVVVPEPTTFAELAEAAATIRRLAAERAQALAGAVKRPAPRAERPRPDARPAPPPGFAFVPPGAIDESAFVRRWARECFDEIGMLGVQRAPLRGDDWRACAGLERRMVAALDALAALGPGALGCIEELAKDAPAADPMRVFAVTMIGGCFAGRDGLGAAERVLHRFGAGDEVVASSFVAALELVPNPIARSVLRSLLASGEPSCRAIALEVLAFREWLTAEDLAELALTEEPRLLELVLPSLAATRHPDFGPALGRARRHDESRVQLAALDAMALGAHPEASSAAREAAVGALGDPALVRLGIVADADDARWLCARMKAAPTAAAIEACGWAGSLDAVPTLLELLDEGSDEAKLAAGAALERLLGAQLHAVIEIEPEALDEPEVPDPDPEPGPPRRALAELVSDPRDRPPEGSKEKLEVASTDPVLWRKAWEEQRPRLNPSERVRRGEPYRPAVSLRELSELPLAVDERRCLHRELAARTGRLTHFDPHDFVVVQEQCLARWATLVGQYPDEPGSWSRPIRR
jgi:hypothetical protein